MQAFPIFAPLAGAIALLSADARACYSCGNGFSTWGAYSDVCAGVSTTERDAVTSCLCGACAAECATFCSSFDACQTSGDPACAFTSSTACDECSASTCAAEASACGADTTGCVSCSAWLTGDDILNLCPDAVNAELALSTCACSGACANKCSNACVQYGVLVLDPSAATQACQNCLLDAAPKGCATTRSACVAN